MDTVVLLVAAAAVCLSQAEGSDDLLFPAGSTVDDVMNTCMDGKNHKSKPGPEANLYSQCSPWAKRSCCTEKTQGIQFTSKWLNFDWHHCGPLSARCTQQFIKDLCFYECSPNVGPYLVPDKKKIRNQRYQNVPICQRSCDYWWDACKNDLTCTDNWTRNFNWTTGINKCPTGSKCETFQKVFGNANNFCENIWDHGFKVVSDSNDCFRLWFSSDENPNEKVARRAAEKLLGLASSSHVVPPFSRVLWVFIPLVFIFSSYVF